MPEGPFRNWDCSNDKCTDPHSEVRVLPYGGGGNLTLCRACFDHEMRFRRLVNGMYQDRMPFETPEWDSLRVYEAV